MEPVIFMKMLRNLSEKLAAKFPATALSYSRVKISRLDDARRDFQPFWESGCLSSSQLLSTTARSLVRSASPWYYIRFSCELLRWPGRLSGKNMTEFVVAQNTKPVGKDVLYALDSSRRSVKLKQELVSKLQEIIASVQDSRHKGYLCNDCHKSLSN